jgi:hypothetical protein
MGCSSFDATKARLILAVRAILAARLERRTGLCFAGVLVAVFGFLVVFALELEEVDSFAAGAAVDCATIGHAIKSNANCIVTARSVERRKGNGRQNPSIIPLYSDLDESVAFGNHRCNQWAGGFGWDLDRSEG